jgi:hypothetical protein
MRLRSLLGCFCCLFVTLSFAQTDNTTLYRTINGQYNNPNRRFQGAAHTALVRFAGDGFADGQSAPAGPNRPNPRTISNAIFAQNGLLNDPVGLSDYTWVYGQFIDHDLSLTEGIGESTPIPVPAGDPQFDPFFFGTISIAFTRNLPRFGTGLGIGNPRNYDNELTAYLDGSSVYGSDNHRAAWLRSLTDGKMKVSVGNMLPYFTVDGEYYSRRDPGAPHMDNGTNYPFPLFVAGDARANENVLLLALHTIFVREHNLQCDRLKAEHPDWNDERLYQHARKMVGGIIQAITYNEWLPTMGVPVGPYTGYDINVNAQVANTFSAAAFRVGHTLLNSNIRRLEANGEVMAEGNLTLRDVFFLPSVVEGGIGLDPYLRGMAEQTQQQFDSKVIDDVRNFLFGPPGAGGLDLPAINIMRGRERGLSRFNQIRQAYNLPMLFDFRQLNPDFNVYNTLNGLYDNNIDELDPWVGMLAERAAPGSIFGATIRRIMEHQFGVLRTGDRFFYLNDPVLTEEEKDEIHQTTFRDVIVRNTGVELMQENVFEAMPFSEICGGQTVPTDGVINVNTTGEALANVMVSAWDSDGIVNNAVSTTDLGFFNFEALPACQEISLTANLDDEWERGINIFDMVAINNVLLGRSTFANPYQWLAADVNLDKSLDIFDIIALASLILGRTESLQAAPAQPWFFVPAGYEFENPDYPYEETVPNNINFSMITPTEVNQGFVAIKLGDVNADAPVNMSGLNPGVEVSITGPTLEPGERGLVTMTFRGDNMAGFQAELASDGLQLLGVAFTDLPADAYQLTDGHLRLLSVDELAEHTLVLHVSALASGVPAQMFRLNDDMPAVAVATDGTPRAVHLGAVAGAMKVEAAGSVYPNPFVESLRLRLADPLESAASMVLMDVNGRELVRRTLAAGTRTASLRDLDLPAGTYLLRLIDEAGRTTLLETLKTAGR